MWSSIPAGGIYIYNDIMAIPSPLKKKSFSAELEQGVQRAVQWVRSHQEQTLAFSGLAVLAVALVIFMVRHRQAENEDAWNQLGSIQSQVMQNQSDPARKALETWEQRFQNTHAATYAKFLKADLQYRTSDYVAAGQIYADLAATGQPADVKPLALSAESSSEEMAGRYPQAEASAKNFTDQYPDHFLAAPMYLAQARLLELMGDPAAASTIYGRFAILYPQSPWTAFARARTQSLAGTPTPLSPIPK